MKTTQPKRLSTDCNYEPLFVVKEASTLDIVATIKHLDQLFVASYGPRRRQIDNTMQILEDELISRVTQ